jgi:hypothetical protein
MKLLLQVAQRHAQRGRPAVRTVAAAFGLLTALQQGRDLGPWSADPPPSPPPCTPSCPGCRAPASRSPADCPARLSRSSRSRTKRRHGPRAPCSNDRECLQRDAGGPACVSSIPSWVSVVRVLFERFEAVAGTLTISGSSSPCDSRLRCGHPAAQLLVEDPLVQGVLIDDHDPFFRLDDEIRVVHLKRARPGGGLLRRPSSGRCSGAAFIASAPRAAGPTSAAAWRRKPAAARPARQVVFRGRAETRRSAARNAERRRPARVFPPAGGCA